MIRILFSGSVNYKNHDTRYRTKKTATGQTSNGGTSDYTHGISVDENSATGYGERGEEKKRQLRRGEGEEKMEKRKEKGGKEKREKGKEKREEERKR